MAQEQEQNASVLQSRTERVDALRKIKDLYTKVKVACFFKAGTSAAEQKAEEASLKRLTARLLQAAGVPDFRIRSSVLDAGTHDLKIGELKPEEFIELLQKHEQSVIKTCPGFKPGQIKDEVLNDLMTVFVSVMCPPPKRSGTGDGSGKGKKKRERRKDPKEPNKPNELNTAWKETQAFKDWDVHKDKPWREALKGKYPDQSVKIDGNKKRYELKELSLGDDHPWVVKLNVLYAAAKQAKADLYATGNYEKGKTPTLTPKGILELNNIAAEAYWWSKNVTSPMDLTKPKMKRFKCFTVRSNRSETADGNVRIIRSMTWNMTAIERNCLQEVREQIDAGAFDEVVES